MAINSPKSITELRNQLRSYYAGMHSRMQRVPDILLHKYKGLPQLPDGVAVHESSTAETLVDNLADQVRTDEPSVTFEPRGKTKKDFENKELMELWGLHIVKQLRVHSFIVPENQVVRDALMMDAACIKFMVDEDALPPPPEREGSTPAAYRKALRQWEADRVTAWPFVVRPVDPRRVYVAPGNHRPPAFVIEVQTRQVIDILQKYGDVWMRAGKSAMGADKWMSKATWVEYWSKEEYRVEVDGIEVINQPNPYGIIPYAFGYTGRGRLSFDGDPTELVYPLLFPYAAELESEVRLKTALDAAWQFYVFKRLLTDEDPRQVAKALQKGPGAVIKVKDLQHPPQWLEEPQPNISALTFLQIVMQSLDKRFPIGLMQRPEGVEAALHQATLIGQALKPLVPIRALLNSLMTDVLNGLAHMMYVLDLKMNVYGSVGDVEKERTVKGADFTNRNFHVVYEATDPAEDDRKVLTGLGLLREKSAQGIPVMSRRTFREKYAPRIMPNSEDEEEQILVENVVDQVLSSGVLLQAVMEMLAAEQQDAAEEQSAMGLQRQIRGAASGAVPGARERALEGITRNPVRGPRETGQEGFENSGA